MDKNGTFRKRKVSFSQVSNEALRDKKLSLRAKGLYSIISSYITLENFTLYKNYLITLSIDGKDSFNRAWDELKATGYLIQYQTKGDGGKYLYEYELLDQPRTLPEDEIILIKQKEKNRVDRNNRKALNKKAKIAPQTEIPPMDEPIDGDSMHGASSDGETVPIVMTDGKNTDVNNNDEETTTTGSGSKLIVVDPAIEDEIEIHTAIENDLGKKPNNSVQLQIKSLLKKQDKDLIIAAIQIAAKNNKEFNYAVGTLKKWREKNIFTIQQYIDSL